MCSRLLDSGEDLLVVDRAVRVHNEPAGSGEDLDACDTGDLADLLTHGRFAVPARHIGRLVSPTVIVVPLPIPAGGMWRNPTYTPYRYRCKGAHRLARARRPSAPDAETDDFHEVGPQPKGGRRLDAVRFSRSVESGRDLLARRFAQRAARNESAWGARQRIGEFDFPRE